MADIANNVNGDNHVARTGLKILIVRAGIGGLSAATVLRQQGYNVEVKVAAQTSMSC